MPRPRRSSGWSTAGWWLSAGSRRAMPRTFSGCIANGRRRRPDWAPSCGSATTRRRPVRPIPTRRPWHAAWSRRQFCNPAEPSSMPPWRTRTEEGELAAGGPLGRQLVDRAIGPAGRRRAVVDDQYLAERGRSWRSARPSDPTIRRSPAGWERAWSFRRTAGVCNAVGAVAGGIMQSVSALISAPNEGLFRVHLPSRQCRFHRSGKGRCARAGGSLSARGEQCPHGRRCRHRVASPPRGQGPSRPQRSADLHREPHRRDRVRPAAGRRGLTWTRRYSVSRRVSAGFQDSQSSSPMEKVEFVVRASFGTLTLIVTPVSFSRKTLLSSP